MLQSRKNHLVLLQVEHGLLRSISSKPELYENIVSRFKMCSIQRLERFSRKWEKYLYFELFIAIIIIIIIIIVGH